MGVSQCLLGDAVRYDGCSRGNTIVLEKLGDMFQLTAVCPEVEAGLSIPRPPVALTGSIDNPKVTGRDDPDIDVTEILQAYCQAKPAQLEKLSGFIFKSRSPSCGLNSTPVFIDGACVTESSRGIFARSLCQLYPDLPVIEDTSLKIPAALNEFINSVFARHP